MFSFIQGVAHQGEIQVGARCPRRDGQCRERRGPRWVDRESHPGRPHLRDDRALDHSSAKIAVLDVTPSGDFYSGTIRFEAIPPQLKRLFQEFEEMVEGQVFSVADEIEDQIAKVQLKVAFANGSEAYVEDLQVYPSTNRVSFKTPAHAGMIP